MRTKLFITSIIFLFSFTVASSAQEYFISSIDYVQGDVITYEGKLYPNSERNFAINDEKLAGKDQFHILSGSTLIILFPKQDLGAYQFYYGHKNPFMSGPSWSHSSQEEIRPDYINSGKIFVADTCTKEGGLWKIAKGEITIRYEELTKSVSIRFDDLQLLPVVKKSKKKWKRT